MFWGEKAAIYEMSGIYYLILHTGIPKSVIGWRMCQEKYLMASEYYGLISESECIDLLVPEGRKLSPSEYQKKIIYKLKEGLRNYPLIFNFLSTNNMMIKIIKKLGLVD